MIIPVLRGLIQGLRASAAAILFVGPRREVIEAPYRFVIFEIQDEHRYLRALAHAHAAAAEIKHEFQIWCEVEVAHGDFWWDASPKVSLVIRDNSGARVIGENGFDIEVRGWKARQREGRPAAEGEGFPQSPKFRRAN